MAAKSGQYLRIYGLLHTTAEVALGSEPENYYAVDASGAYSDEALGVVEVTRDGFVSICVLGQMPCKVENGATFVAGDALTTNEAGEVKKATAGDNVLGIALEPVTNALDLFAEIFVKPVPTVAA